MVRIVISLQHVGNPQKTDSSRSRALLMRIEIIIIDGFN
jgi:hypothetical protein